METYWVPGVNRSGAYGRWAFAEFTDVYTLQEDFSVRGREQPVSGLITLIGGEYVQLHDLRLRRKARKACRRGIPNRWTICAR